MNSFLLYLLHGRKTLGDAFQKALDIVGLSILYIAQSDIRQLHSVPQRALRQSEGKSTQVESSTQLRHVLLSIRHQGWGYILTLDESWFSLSADNEMIWVPDGDEVADREKHMIQSPKLMLTFVWNLHEFQVVDAMACHAMPKGEMFPAAPISEIFSLRSLLGME
jgi:hypothetical protein